MKLTLLAAALSQVVVLAANALADGAGKACDKWDIFTDFGLFEGAVHKTDKGFAAHENGICFVKKGRKT